MMPTPLKPAFHFASAIALLAAITSCVAIRKTNAPAPGAAGSESAATSGPACFPVEHLTPARQVLARTLLLRAMDSEALYTIAAPIKPTSSGFADLRLRVKPTVDPIMRDSLAEYHAILPAMSCGNVAAFLSVYGTTYSEGSDTAVRVRYVSLTLVNKSALQQTVQKHSGFFSTLAILPTSDVSSILGAVEYADRSPRWRGYGYLFGYPDPAVDFFVRAGEKGDSIDAITRVAGGTRSHVEPRDFRFVETFHKSADCTGCAATRPSFVYAVAKGSAATAEDASLLAAAAPVYAEYVRRRGRYITASSNGIDALLREWASSGWQVSR